ncbi:MAG: exopolyphosphatase [Weeksellaceae bacterium]|jgi:exopolyphosphatase/guanosine-5'-triphosphate,3'-diphosphate pyrophosphatase|nr:exopolyphosphatase [Weeksellaceae bacterium]MDX9704708.1 exopolyphosphatase [Weeksellaceae bacterium]
MNIHKLAAIDIGSNAMRLLINYVYEFPEEQAVFNKTCILRMPIRLGKDVFTNQMISEKNTKRMIEAMTAFKLTMNVYGVNSYLAYATSAMREAENGKKIIKKIQEKSKIEVEIIDGKTEAELIFTSELQKFILNENNYLYVDVGGGSTELTLIKNGDVILSKSFEVGTVRLLNEKVEQTVFPEMKKWVEENISQHNVDLIGSGGNINHIYKYSGIKLGRPMPGTYLRNRYKIVKSMNFEERLRELNMKPDRADVVEFALEIYIKIMKWSNAQKIHVPKIGITDGMIRSIYSHSKQAKINEFS